MFATGMKKFLESNHEFIFWSFLIVLLLLRIPFLGWIPYLNPTAMVWVKPIYEIGTYLLIALLICVEWDNLQIHNIDPLAIIIIIICKPLSTILLLFINPTDLFTFPKPFSLLFFIISIFLISVYLKRKVNSNQAWSNSIWWFVCGGIIGITFYVLEGLGMIKLLHFPFPPNPGVSSLIYPFYQLGYAAVPEEPVFRGFLWGGLRKAGVKDIWILFIQAFLFTLAHIGMLSLERGALYIALIFMCATVMGVLVWRSKRLSSSIAFHGFGNGSAIFQYWIYSVLLK